METAAAPTTAPHVLVVPFPAQGHTLPLLDYAALLAARGLRLTVVTSPANLPLLSPLLAAHPGAVSPLTLPFPSNSSIPPGLESVRGCPPEYFPVFIHVLTALREPVRAWATSRPSSDDDPIVAVVADFFCGWAQPLARELGAAGIVFSPSGVLGAAVPHSLFRQLVRRPAAAEGGGEESSVVTFPAIPGEPAYRWRELSMLYRWYVEGGEEDEQNQGGTETARLRLDRVQMGRLLLAEEDWLEKHKHRFHPGAKPGGSGGGAGGSSSKGKAVARSDGGASGPIKLTSEGTPMRKGRCRNCGIYGHWAEDCKRPKKERKKEGRAPEARGGRAAPTC
ncbi:unnamed protein product [Miscanthus lutarioriparius]|uniref:CCHC-type domain-containing protein n=1 Tax=Miscanthus lutarioriparius TaxID=422564 RepID=A0A811QZL9_9POAL|nr:unnamed protein product [Miscanthus lutarioriparius]